MRAIATEGAQQGVRSSGSSYSLHATVVIAALGAALSALPSAASAAGAAEAKKIFNSRCTACHTFGKGVKVGPDLKGVTERRPRAWLMQFIRSSQRMIESGDPVAVALFDQFKRQRMPDWTDLSEEQIGAILDWLAANGPEQKPADERIAELATPAEIELGHDLFHGEVELASGGMACSSCHAVSEGGDKRGGTLGPELTDAYAAYRDRAMTLVLKKPCFRRSPDSESGVYLTPQESFGLKAYLRKVALPAQTAAGLTGTGVDTAGKPADWPPPPPGAGVTSSMHRRGAGSVIRSEALFFFLPYVAALIFFAGLGIRHALVRRNQTTLAADAREAWDLFGGTMLWRLGFVAIVLAHLAGLVIPRAILAWNGETARLLVLEGIGLLCSLLLLYGWARIMWRHLGRPPSARRGRAAEAADTALLSLLFLGIASGLLIAIVHRWASSWAAGILSPYLQSLLRGEPVVEFAAQMPFLIKLHIISLFGIMVVLPLSSAALIPIAAAERAIALASRPLAAGRRASQSAMARLSPARWLWPEEDRAELAGSGAGAGPLADEVMAAEAQPERGLVYPAGSKKHKPT